MAGAHVDADGVGPAEHGPGYLRRCATTWALAGGTRVRVAAADAGQHEPAPLPGPGAVPAGQLHPALAELGPGVSRAELWALIEATREDGTMKTYGQLIHVEEFHRDGVRYRIAVFRVQGGSRGTWSCDMCLARNEDTDPSHPTVEECVAGTKKLIDRHHREEHSGRPAPQSKDTTRGA